MSDGEREPKPKKQYEIVITGWDDGEMDVDPYIFMETGTGRGRPKKVWTDAKEFKKQLDSMTIKTITRSLNYGDNEIVGLFGSEQEAYYKAADEPEMEDSDQDVDNNDSDGIDDSSSVSDEPCEPPDDSDDSEDEFDFDE